MPPKPDLKLDSSGDGDDFYVYEPRQYGNLVANGTPQRFFYFNNQLANLGLIVDSTS